MHQKVYEIVESSSTLYGVYSALYDLYTQTRYSYADAVSNNYEYLAYVVSKKEYEMPFDKFMETSATRRSELCLDVNTYQTKLIKARILNLENVLNNLRPKVESLLGRYSSPEDYDTMRLLESIGKDGKESFSYLQGSGVFNFLNQSPNNSGLLDKVTKQKLIVVYRDSWT